MRNQLERLKEREWHVFVFGGVARDLMDQGAYPNPRDIDLVVEGGDTSDIRAVFRGDVSHQNRFGGVSIETKFWELDVWPVHRTWAFHHGWSGPSRIEDLPRTTFLNVEAVVIELWTQATRPRRIYEHGFFDAFEKRVVEINFEPNPSPAFCVLRSLLVSQRLKFSLGPKLVRYIDSHRGLVHPAELVEMQLRHYGRVAASEKQILQWYLTIEKHAKDGQVGPLLLRYDSSPRQSDLFAGQQVEIWPTLGHI